MGRGIWNVDGEIDMGLGSSIDSLCTIFVDDPNFGRVCYGGNLKVFDDRYEVYPLDGVRNKFFCRLDGFYIDITIKRDQFSDTEPIVIYRNLDVLEITINNTSKTEHNLELKISGKNANEFSMKINENLIIADQDNRRDIYNVHFKDKGQVVVCLSK